MAVLHPFPSALNAILVGVLATVAGATPAVVLALAVAMFGYQVSIGALNDIVDAEHDRVEHPRKPIPDGDVSRSVAWLVVLAGGAVGLIISALFGMAVLLVGLIGYGSGLAYDLALRRVGLGWLAFAVAFPALLAWVWLAATDGWPPGSVVLLPLAAVAGPTIHLANGMVDPDADVRSGVSSLATRLGPRRAIRVLAVAQTTILSLGWATLVIIGHGSGVGILAAAVATVVTLAGVVASASGTRRLRDAGWMMQAAAIAILAAGWLAAAARA